MTRPSSRVNNEFVLSMRLCDVKSARQFPGAAAGQVQINVELGEKECETRSSLGDADAAWFRAGGPADICGGMNSAILPTSPIFPHGSMGFSEMRFLGEMQFSGGFRRGRR
jgi:hypothetical protein